MSTPIDPQLLDVLAGLGIPLDDAQRAALAGHLAMIRQYQASISLVSQGDLAALEERHLHDSLALAPWLRWAALTADPARPLHLDIGSGSGFPAIPLAIALPERDFVLIERSQKKSDFLHLVAATLRLKNVKVQTGQFPADAEGLHPATITARAVEKPDWIWQVILAWMPPGANFLSQFAVAPPTLPPGVREVLPIPDSFAAMSPWQRGAVRLYRHEQA